MMCFNLLNSQLNCKLTIFVGVVKSLATDGGKVITRCISVQCKGRFKLFASPSYSTTCNYCDIKTYRHNAYT